jgi:hypothetical protein
MLRKRDKHNQPRLRVPSAEGPTVGGSAFEKKCSSAAWF